MPVQNTLQNTQFLSLPQLSVATITVVASYATPCHARPVLWQARLGYATLYRHVYNDKHQH